MMAKAVSDARRPDGTAGPDAIYRRLFGSFNPDQDGRVSPLEVLNRLERIESLPPYKQRALLTTIDSFLRAM